MKLLYLFLTAVVVAAAIQACVMDENKESVATDLPFEVRMPSLGSSSTWINSEPLSDDALRGKVVLVGFWTYTCINWRRQLPYLRAWNEKYKDKGLVIIGVHTPEFGFEKDLDSVRRAVSEMRIQYPIVLDSDYSIWSDFANRYWPALYFVDARGNIRHHQFGEGEYEKSEIVIQQLLKEAGASEVEGGIVSIDPRGEEVAADWNNLRSPENYLGYDRTENFSSPGGATLDKPRNYEFPPGLELNDWALAGTWTFGGEGTKLDSESGRVKLRFHARDVHLVMGPGTRGSSIRFRVLIDGQPPVDSHGVDIDANGNGSASESKMYQLIRQTGAITDREIEIEFLDPGIEVFAFTFG